MAEILILEDMEAFRRMLSSVLREDGHDITASESGEIIYESGVVEKTDVMITDINMPWVDGIEAILQARKVNPDLKVIAMTGGSVTMNNDYLSACRHFGASATLRKPFELNDMVAEVRRVLAA